MIHEFFDIYLEELKQAQEMADTVLKAAGFSQNELSSVYQSAYIDYRSGLLHPENIANPKILEESITSYIIDCIFSSVAIAIEDKYALEYEAEILDVEWNPLRGNRTLTIVYKGQKYNEMYVTKPFLDMNTISEEMIQKGIEKNIVQFVIDPNLDVGTVCRIGSDWFYFDSQEAEQINPKEYLKQTQQEEIVSKIFTVLEDFKEVEETKDEYQYILYFLKENGIF